MKTGSRIEDRNAEQGSARTLSAPNLPTAIEPTPKSATWGSKDAGVTGIHFALIQSKGQLAAFDDRQERGVSISSEVKRISSEQFRAVNVLT